MAASSTQQLTLGIVKSGSVLKSLLTAALVDAARWPLSYVAEQLMVIGNLLIFY